VEKTEQETPKCGEPMPNCGGSYLKNVGGWGLVTVVDHRWYGQVGGGECLAFYQDTGLLSQNQPGKKKKKGRLGRFEGGKKQQGSGTLNKLGGKGKMARRGTGLKTE